MVRSVAEHPTRTVLRACGLVVRSQQLDFKSGQVIRVDAGVRDAMDECPVAWDGEVPPQSSTLDSNEHGLPPGSQ